ncbi:MAG: hypothetical protein IMF01_09415 [Proteobacteria bacterium]|nr:hypothetical protein [Pseudomonadota bacterium]
MSKSKNDDNSKKAPGQVNGLMIEIVAEAKKLARNETTSCYELITKTKELITLEKYSTTEG